MSEADEILKVISDFRKGKTGSPEHTSAILSWDSSTGIPDLTPTKQSTDYAELAKEYPAAVAGLRRCTLEPTVSVLAGMLSLPDLQANCIRLEALVHLAIRHCRGKATPTSAQIAAWFKQMDNGTCGLREDPAEIPFISNLTHSSGNYRLFGGQDEANAFHTQIFLDMFESLAGTHPLRRLERSCLALLTLSETLAERRALPRNLVGEITPRSDIPKMDAGTMAYLKYATLFTPRELAELDIDVSDLTPFILQPRDQGRIDASFFGNSPVEAKPLIMFEKGLLVLLPSALGLALRRFVVDSCLHDGSQEELASAIEKAYLDLFRAERVLGDLRLPAIAVTETQGVRHADITMDVDEGRYIQILFFFDDFSVYERGGFAGVNPPEPAGSVVRDLIDRARADVTQKTKYREGITLLIGCGWGRGLGMRLPPNMPSWRFEALRAADLVTFSRVPKFTALDLFKMLRAKAKAWEAGIRIDEAGSLLNLFGWIDDLNGHVVRHEELSEEHFKGELGMPVMLPTNCALGPRLKAADAFDAHISYAPDGRRAYLQRFSEHPPLGADARTPLYVDTYLLGQPRFRGVYEGERGHYWAEIVTSPSLDPITGLHLNGMVLNWAELVGRHVLDTFEYATPPQLMWRVVFEDEAIPTTPPMPEELSQGVSISVETGGAKYLPVLSVGAGFLALCRYAENTAEKTLVRHMIISALSALHLPPSFDVDQLLARVARDEGARFFHAFALTDVRDDVRHNLPKTGQIIEDMDDANGRLGLGWLARSRDEGGTVEGLPECRSYLDALVAAIATRMEALLLTLDREATIGALILNQEALSAEAEQWRRTYRATRAVSDHPEATARAFGEKISRLNMAGIASRIAAELALCAAPPSGGRTPGTLDIASLMADASELYHMGGFSDAMRAGAMRPEIKISPAGDVMMNHSFSDKVVQPMGRNFQAISLARSEDGFRSNYAFLGHEIGPQAASQALQADFLDAFSEEFGFSVDDLQALAHAFASLAEERGEPLLVFGMTELVNYLVEKTRLSDARVREMVQQYSLVTRANWQTVPDGILSNAWCPWRFGRQLSLLLRPIIQFDDTGEPRLMIAPAMIVHHLNHVLNATNRGSLDQEVFRKGGKLRRYVGAKNGTDGEAFNARVAERIREFGWRAEPGLTDGEILARPKDPAFGDVDVLAWSVESKRVIAIECKDLSFDKTFGEIARRLAKFRGEIKADGKRDELLKHLNRVDILRAEKYAVAKFVGFEPIEIESVLLTSQPGPLQFDQNVAEKGVQAIAYRDIEVLLQDDGPSPE